MPKSKRRKRFHRRDLCRRVQTFDLSADETGDNLGHRVLDHRALRRHDAFTCSPSPRPNVIVADNS